MRVVSARVRNGTIVPDLPVELPEGAVVEVVVPDDEKVERVELELELVPMIEPLIDEPTVSAA